MQTVVADWLRSLPAGERRKADDRRQRPDHADHHRRSSPRPELGVADRAGDGAVAVDADQDQVEDGRRAQQDVRGQPEVAQDAAERPVAEQLVGERQRHDEETDQDVADRQGRDEPVLSPGEGALQGDWKALQGDWGAPMETTKRSRAKKKHSTAKEHTRATEERSRAIGENPGRMERGVLHIERPGGAGGSLQGDWRALQGNRRAPTLTMERSRAKTERSRATAATTSTFPRIMTSMMAVTTTAETAM